MIGKNFAPFEKVLMQSTKLLSIDSQFLEHMLRTSISQVLPVKTLGLETRAHWDYAG
jgi:hypothetical protein